MDDICYEIVTNAGERTMIVTLEQSIEIYARASHRWFGAKASQKTQERIEHLARMGDAEGATIHERVKQHIGKLEQNALPPSARECEPGEHGAMPSYGHAASRLRTRRAQAMPTRNTVSPA
jgi:hypothetical protein